MVAAFIFKLGLPKFGFDPSKVLNGGGVALDPLPQRWGRSPLPVAKKNLARNARKFCGLKNAQNGSFALNLSPEKVAKTNQRKASLLAQSAREEKFCSRRGVPLACL